MFSSIKGVFLFTFVACFEVYSLNFDNFKNDLSIKERNEIASRCIMESMSDSTKIVDTVIHIVKGQHAKSMEEVCAAPVVPLCIPIKCESAFLNFVRDFYLLFDTSVERKGAVTKLNELLQNGSISVRDMDIALQDITRTFLINVSFNGCAGVKAIMELNSEIRSIIKFLNCIPTRKQELAFMSNRLEAAKKAVEKIAKEAGTENVSKINTHLKAIEAVDIKSEESKVIKSFEKLRGEFCRAIKEKTLSLLSFLGGIKNELDPQIRFKLLEVVVPSIRLAVKLFVDNLVTNGPKKDTKISPEDMNSILDESRGKPQIVSTRKYIPTSFVQYVLECIAPSTLNKGVPPSYDLMIKAVVSKELELIYLSTFFPELLK